MQLDQNQAKANTQTSLAEGEKINQVLPLEGFSTKYLKKNLERGFNIEQVKDVKGNAMSYTINETMMRINLVSPLKPGEKFRFNKMVVQYQ